MRVGIMLRSIDEKGGVGVYSRFLVNELCEIDRKNQYVLFYKNKDNLGRYGCHENVIERHVKASNKAIWDQIVIPYACKKEKIDVLLNPKFTVPLFAPCKTIMTLHGTAWFTHPQFFNKWDLKYIQTIMPFYLKKSSSVISISKLCTENFYKIFKVPQGKITTVYFGPAKHFRRIDDVEKISKVKEKYKIPDKFILTLSGYDRGRRKNIDKILEAYSTFHGKTDHKLVIGGKDCERFRQDYSIPEEGYGKDICFPGWIEQEDLPVFYTLADLYLYPSNAEAFPIPLTEAMACGTPILTSNVNGLKEIAGDAALFVDPENIEEISDGIHRILKDPGLQMDLSRKALKRSEVFDWGKCARETIQILERVTETGNT